MLLFPTSWHQTPGINQIIVACTTSSNQIAKKKDPETAGTPTLLNSDSIKTLKKKRKRATTREQIVLGLGFFR